MKILGIILMLVGVFFFLLQFSIWNNTPTIKPYEGVWVTMGTLIRCVWAILLAAFFFVVGFNKIVD